MYVFHINDDYKYRVAKGESVQEAGVGGRQHGERRGWKGKPPMFVEEFELHGKSSIAVYGASHTRIRFAFQVK